MEWYCTHCFKSCCEECLNGFIVCPTCGKVLGEVGVRRNSYLRKARLKRMKRVKKKKPAIEIEPDPSNSSSTTMIRQSKFSTDGSKKANFQPQPIQGWSQSKSNTKMNWCTHCLKARRTELSGDFICCCFCGKVFGEVTEEELLNGAEPDLKESKE